MGFYIANKNTGSDENRMKKTKNAESKKNWKPKLEDWEHLKTLKKQQQKNMFPWNFLIHRRRRDAVVLPKYSFCFFQHLLGLEKPHFRFFLLFLVMTA